jgi:tRNA 5-methylaminomethyl-2-thiouridine biosynthesis bifunctional protein
VTEQTNITFKVDGSPYSTQFEDIYFDTNQGSSQSEYVFITGNNIRARLKKRPAKFVIAETGFGTGLNFLLTLQLFAQLQQELINDKNKPAAEKLPTSLRFISVEKYPLSKAQLEQSLKILPELAQYSQQLLDKYPEQPDENVSLSFLNGSLTLDLIFNDATAGFAQLATNKRGINSGVVDAWFLDGFSPAKNPEMWQAGLFQQITRLSKEQATLATFTVSGKGYQQRAPISKPQHVSIIGGGIASACAAYALTKSGVKVTLYCKDFSVAQGASSNHIGALFPLIHQQKDEISLFYQQAFQRALECYKGLYKEGFHFDHDWCGLLEISYKPALCLRQKTIEDSAIWPTSLIHGVDQEQASKLAGIELEHGGLFMPNAGWISPPQLVQQLLKASEKTNRLRIETGCKITKVSQHPDGSTRLHTDQALYKASIIIYCGGAESIPLNMVEQLPLTSVRGQVSAMATTDKMEKLSTVICHKGYLTPENNGLHCIGATFQKGCFDITAKLEEDEFNLNMLEKCLPGLSPWQQQDVVTSKARLRCMTPDHLPMVGPIPNIAEHKQSYAHLSKDKNWRYYQKSPVISNMYCLTGLGARGLCTAPLLADILTADICGTPYPVDNEQLFNLAPNRFVVRDIIRRKFDE